MEELQEEIATLKAQIKAMKQTVKRLEALADPLTTWRISVPAPDWAAMYRRADAKPL